jgi:hypothetical protein
VSFRLDGVLAPVCFIEAADADRVFGRIKYLARLKTYQDSLPQDGRINKADIGTRHDIRVATYPTVTGEKIVLRLFNESSTRNLDALDLPSVVCDTLHAFLSRPSGLLLLTGPAGSGKTTTIYACLRHLAGQGGRHIITVEDPVEQVIAGIMQTEVNEAESVRLAAVCTNNREILRRGEFLVDRLAAGERLTEALGVMDDTGDVAWRWTTASSGQEGFVASLRGWSEALSARADRTEQAVAHVVSSVTVLAIGFLVLNLMLAVWIPLMKLQFGGLMW